MHNSICPSGSELPTDMRVGWVYKIIMTDGIDYKKCTLKNKKWNDRIFAIDVINRKVEELMRANPTISKGELCEQTKCSQYTMNKIYMRLKRVICARPARG